MSQDVALQEILATVQAWFDEQARREPGKTVARTTLQIGVFNELLFDYQPGRSSLDVDLGFGQGPASTQAPCLTPAQVGDELVPALALAFRRALASADPALLDYHFRLRATFPTTEGQREWLVLELLDEPKRQALLARINAYIDSKLRAGSYDGKPLESFFLSRHLLDPRLFPDLDAAWTIAQFEQMQQLRPGRQAALAEHRGNLIRAGTSWAEDCFLPRYFEVRRSEYRANDYVIKPGAQDGANDAQIDLLLYVAVMILRHEPSYAKPAGLQFIQLATQLGSERAARMLTEGSGSFAQDAINLATDQVSCTANDVFATIHIAIKEEGAAAYAQALDFVTHLLENGFPKSYQIKLKSSCPQLPARRKGWPAPIRTAFSPMRWLMWNCIRGWRAMRARPSRNTNSMPIPRMKRIACRAATPPSAWRWPIHNGLHCWNTIWPPSMKSIKACRTVLRRHLPHATA